jgi:hypothetical protein
MGDTMKSIEILGGGTVFHIRNHLALTAPAYGTTARLINDIILDQMYDLVRDKQIRKYDVSLYLTKMACQGKGNLETNQDIEKLVDKLIANPDTKIIFFNVALVDYEATVLESGVYKYHWTPDIFPSISGKYEERLKTSDGERTLRLTPSAKLISKIRKERKDIFLVGFKTTCGATEDEQFLTGLHLLKSSSCNLVLANDTKTRTNMIITPEQARYSVTTNRQRVLEELVKMALARSDAHFTRSTVVNGDSIPWSSHLIPSNLRVVVDHCIKAGAYKPFNGATVGHFAVKVNSSDFITSKRKVDFNKLKTIGMVLCRAETENSVVAFGSKPSVGGQSQRIVFKDHPGTDCIVHFHCPVIPGMEISTRSQKNFECGSHECGKNTSDGLNEEFPGIKCVYLDNHGPNIVFSREIHPKVVIDFIERHFDLSKSTDGVDRNKASVS